MGYGTNYFGYRFWDSEKRKAIRSKDATFNENELYKGQSESEVKAIDLEKVGRPEDAVFEDEVGDEVISHDDDLTEEGSIPGDEPVSQVEEPVVMEPVPTEPNSRYLTALNHLLLTDLGEPEDHCEATKSGDAVKWDQAFVR